MSVAVSINQEFICAGGNMILNVNAANKVRIASHEFARSAFEDVDLQYRLARNNFQNIFVPNLLVRHVHSLTFAGLLKKSLLSGRGLALCRYYHTGGFAKNNRWDPKLLIIRSLFFYKSGGYNYYY